MERMIENLSNSGLLFWLGALIGFLLILAIWGTLKAIVKHRVQSRKMQVILNILLNWFAILSASIYIFNYLFF